MRPAFHASIIATCSCVITAPKPMSAPVAPSRNDSRMKLSFPVSSVIGRGRSSSRRAVSTKRRASNDASLIATTPSTDAIARSVSGSKFSPASAGWSWNRISGRPTSAIASWYGDGDPRVERLAQVGRDREDQERVGAGGLELGRLADGGGGRRPGHAGDDRDVRRLVGRPRGRAPSRRGSGAVPRRCRR